MPPSLPERYNSVMAKKFLTGLRLVNLSSDPETGSEGEIYFNTSNDAIKLYANNSWNFANDSNKNLDGGNPSSIYGGTSNINGGTP